MKISEIKLFLILIPVINVFNYYLTYNNIELTQRTLITFAIDTIEGYAAWSAVHFIIIYLDRKFPFERNVLRRIGIQITTTLFAGMAIIIGMTVLIHYIMEKGPFPMSFFRYDVFIISVWFLVINGIYVSIHFFREWQTSQTKRNEENKVKLGGLRIKSGKHEIVVGFDDIAGFSMDGEYIMGYTLAGKKFLVDQSMDKLEKLLPRVSFFRLNRQILLHRQVIAGFEKAGNGKLKIVANALFFSSPINVSRTKASEFKSWFYPD